MVIDENGSWDTNQGGDKMFVIILEDLEFEKRLIKYGDTLEDAQGTAAFCVDDFTFFRASYALVRVPRTIFIIDFFCK